MNLIGLRIRNIRKEKSLTLKDLAQGIVSIPYLANIENGVKLASMETLMHIARRLEVPEEVLLVNEEETNMEVLQELQLIFELLVFSKTEDIETKLNKIASKVDLVQESPAVELAFYCLKASYYYKIWEFSKAEEIEVRYLNNNEKRAECNFPIYLLTYYYYCQSLKHAFVTCDYKLVENYWKKCIEITDSPSFQVVFHINICINYICQNLYEPALSHVEAASDLLNTIPDASFELKGSLLYFYGYIYFQIGFLTEAKKHFNQAVEFYSLYPELTSKFYFVIRFKLAEIEKIEGNETQFDENIILIYDEIIAFENRGIDFANNDFLVITELMVIFAEKGWLEEATELMRIMSKVTERVMELDYFIEYTETLLLYHEKEQASYEKNMIDLLKKIEESNDPVLIERVKKHASKHFAKSTKYKMAYDILS
ncbi:helix-turn-helix transcriptional regulator [Listeria sp. FSL L7-0091]|uniref:Helix-turn-helix transcriptional regulator n=1 Tax=Listeria farberi TaxID=2713500 RepID=A0A7X1DE49_9LIST|nr:helix-turn-helix transcriptional regulator [Listeria farberi]MBC1375297.1 helix-turn-helix transcriptional regulator [Listeria farberi]MBC1381714.1 helix-turn-helix transcriptional regulator [Listeria farberi]MBC2260010.1 helix-turn-helix transcriptional regulator [Listeria farberi]MBC2268555.1 helix-turn-helix transcriptional regulator [Listeria farberi]MBC2287314.1 helix-turn-helix transcriptional regulator [Listeria farberi]